MKMTLKQIISENSDFIGNEYKVYFSPGRVNLIGEHIDYLGGNVFPTAINLGTYAVVSPRQDDKFYLLSHNFKKYGNKEFDLKDLSYNEERNWANYASGMVQAFIEKGMTATTGLNILVYGTLPNSAGLSSSASLEVLIGTVLKNEYKFDIPMLEIVKTAQKVENSYIGVNCGIMDQFAVGMSKEHKAIYLNTETLDYKLVPLELEDYTLVIANTNKKRTLADSKYNERRAECDVALHTLKSNEIDIQNLCDMDEDFFKKVVHLLPSNTIKMRVRHAVTENDRTKNAVKALESKNLELFGKLMNHSHDSLKNDYIVSCLELDTLVDSFRKNGATGSRMTGAGFGGCTISLIKTNLVQSVIAEVKKEYHQKIGYQADFYLCKTSDGARQLKEEEIV
jgi:galactokinase